MRSSRRGSTIFMLRGSSDIAFVIGGSDGVSDGGAPAPTRCSALDALPCRTTWRVWCC